MTRQVMFSSPPYTMHIYFAALALALIGVLSQTEDEEPVPVSDILKLTSANYTSWVEEQPLALVEYYIDDCEPCNMLSPHVRPC